ncbi:MAG: methionyl-tRNA formyltransferase [Eubacteriales bacterium]
MRILFMGTPEFAVGSFRLLCENFEVIGAVTQPDKPKGRGYTLTPPPVKVAAIEAGIPVFQPETLKNEAFLPVLQKLNPDLIAVVAYGKLLPPYLLNYPRYGCVNVHGSLLPKYRGAAPMQRAIIDGENVTGVTTMLMAEGLDTGDMLLSQSVEIGPDDDFEIIHDRLSDVGAKLLVETVQKLSEGSCTPMAQNDSEATYAAKIEKSDCLIVFSGSARDIHNQIRGLSPFPLAYTTKNGQLLKIVKSTLLSEDGHCGEPGTVYSLRDGVIAVSCGQGAIGILRLLPEGKGRMSASDYINGRKIEVGDRLGL